jgi:hypothetical protein
LITATNPVTTREIFSFSIFIRGTSFILDCHQNLLIMVGASDGDLLPRGRAMQAGKQRKVANKYGMAFYRNLR